MPRYSITDSNTGTTLVVEGDSPPSEQEAAELFASAPQIKDTERRASRVAPSPYGIGTMREDPEGMREGTSTMMRYGPPIIAGMATGGLSIGAQMAAGALAGGVGEVAARGVEGNQLGGAEGLSEAAKAAILGSTPVLRGSSSVIKSAFKTAAPVAGAMVAGETARREIAQAGLPEDQQTGLYDNAVAAMQEAAPLSFGLASLAGIAGVGSKVAGSAMARQRTMEEAKEVFRGAGVPDATLAMAFPENAALERNLYAARADIKKAVDAVPSQIAKEALSKVSGAPTNEEIARRIGPLIRIADATEKAVGAAEASAAQARATAEDLVGRVAADPKTVAAIRQNIVKGEVARAQAVASAKFAEAQGFDNIVSSTAQAAELSKVLKSGHKAASDVAGELYAKTGIAPDEAIIDLALLKTAARTALGNRLESPAGRAVNQVLGQVKEPTISWNQFKELRSQFQDALDVNAGQSDNVDRLLGEVYTKMGDAFASNLSVVKPDAYKPYLAAQKFWSDVSAVRHGNLGRALFDVPIRDVDGKVVSGVKAETIDSIASDLIAGKADKWQAYKQFVELLESNPTYGAPVAGHMTLTMKGAIRDAIIRKNDKTPGKVVESLLKASQSADLRPYVESMGFGDISRLNSLETALKGYGKDEVTWGLLDELSKNPNTAEVLSIAKAEEAALLAIAGAQEPARKAYQEARAIAFKAGIQERALQARMDVVKNSPLLAPFKGLGGTTLAKDANGTGGETLSTLLNKMGPTAAARVMGALRQKSPDWADRLSRRIWADELNRLMRTERQSPGTSAYIDVDNLYRLFHPQTEADKLRLSQLSKITGDTTTKRFGRFVDSLKVATDNLREAGYVKETTQEMLASAASAIGAVRGVGNFTPQGLSILTKRITNALQGGYYNWLVWTATSPEFAKAMTLGGSASQALAKGLNDLPTRRAYLILSDHALANEVAALDEQP